MVFEQKRKNDQSQKNDSKSAKSYIPIEASRNINIDRQEINQQSETESNTGCISLNIEETNKLRAKLGLALLEQDTDATTQQMDFVHVPAKNIGDSHLEDKYREKLQLMKEKRLLFKELKKIPKIYETVDDIDTADWIAKLRQTPIPQHVPEQGHTPKPTPNNTLTVEHDQSEFTIGDEAILTLKDSNVLDDEEDKLVNLNLIESRKARENIKNRNKVSNYNPYDELDEETGQLKPAQLLSKYDDEIYGKRVPVFTIETQNIVPVERSTANQFLESMKHIDKQSLNSNIKLNQEYFTREEAELKFKKRRKQKTRLKAEDAEIEAVVVPDYACVDEDDSAQVELQLALERARKSKLKSIVYNEELIKNIVEDRKCNDEEMLLNSSLTIDAFSEFVRSHDSAPVVKHVSNIVEHVEGKDAVENKVIESAHSASSKLFSEEQVVGRGLGVALQLLTQKGYLGDDIKEMKCETNIPKTEIVVDRRKMRTIHRDSYNDKRGRNEEEKWKFEIDVGYYDKHGVALDKKDAFREISYKFHGKRPAKKKMIKRAEKRNEKTISTDTVKSLSIMKEKQKSNQTPFLVLSGSNMNLLNCDKDKKKH